MSFWQIEIVVLKSFEFFLHGQSKRLQHSLSYRLKGILSEVSTNFSVQRHTSHDFSSVACDQTIKQMVNRDSKSKGGLTGF